MKVSSAIDVNLLFEQLKSPLSVVVLDRCYDMIHDEKIQRLLARVMALKIAGYGAKYPYGVLPVDGSDLVATHLLLCEEKLGEYYPIMGFKSITISRCKTFNLPFSAFGVLRGNNLPNHEKVLNDFVLSAQEKDEDVAYIGSLAIDPRVKADKNLSLLCTDMVIATLIEYYLDRRIKNIISVPAIRFQVDQVNEFIGYEYFSFEGKRLENFECKPFFGEKVALMYLQKFSDQALFWAKRYSFLWESRVELSPVSVLQENEKRAA